MGHLYKKTSSKKADDDYFAQTSNGKNITYDVFVSFVDERFRKAYELRLKNRKYGKI